MPNDWLRYKHDMSHEARLETLMGWLTRSEGQTPDFATLYFSDVDSAGHSFGPDSQEVRLATEKVDQSIGKLLEALNAKSLLHKTTMVIVSDHGMALAPESQVIQVKTLLSAFPAAKWEWLGPTSGVRLNGESSDGVMRALSALSNLTCWPKQSMPERFKFGTHRRIPDIVCLSDVGYSVSDNPDRKGPLGHHGYDPAHPDMHGILIVSGPNIRQVELGLVNNLEVYGLLTKLLDIKAERNARSSSLPQLLLK
jgi:predicted AlkP superfamily pyrophosphatase or phosphodiesterase